MKRIILFSCILLAFFASGSTYGQNVLAESFDGTTFVPSGWAQGIVSSSTSRTWARVTSSTSPTCSPNSGAGMARYNSFSYSSGSSAYLRTANIDMSARGSSNATVSFYFFRDVSNYTTTTYSDEGITVWVSTSSSTYTTGSNLGFVPRAGNYSATGMASGAATSTATQWIKYTYNLPSAYSTSTNYVYFVAVSKFGNRMTLDDVSSDIINPCTGLPSPGNTTSTSASVCTSASFTLGLQNTTNGTGVTYQWSSSPDNSTWTNVSGATLATLPTTQSSATYYRCLVTCTNSSQSAYSNSLQVGMLAAWACNSYCASNATNTADTKIDSVFWDNTTMGGSSGTNCETYTIRTSTLGTAQQSGTYNLRIRNGSCSGNHYAAYVSVFVDWNQNGSFADAGDSVISYGPTTALNTLPTLSIPIPVTATIGQTRMRLVLREGTSGPPACGTYAYGETEDYGLDIQAAPPCLITVVGGTASGSTNITAGPPATTYTLTGSNGNIQWQYATASASGPWTNISGATTASQSLQASSPGTVYLRAYVSSTSCTPDSSNVLTITVNSRTGDSQTNPIQIGTLTSAYSDTQSNTTGSGFNNDYTGTNNQANADIFYSFTTGPCIDSITISLCGATFDTYLHLLDASGNWIVSNDDNGPLCAGLQSSIARAVTPNTVYYVVTEGYSTGTGSLPLVITPFDGIPLVAPSISGPSGPQCGSVTLSASPAFASYSWSTGGNGSSEIVTSSGNVTVIGTDVYGCISPVSGSFTTDIVTPPSANAGVDVNVCTNVSATINASPISNAYNGLWTVVSGSGSFANSTNNSTLVSSLSQTNVYQWTVTDVGNICPSASDQVTVNSVPRPTNLTSANATSSTVDVSWTAPVNPDSFLVRYQENCTGTNYYKWVSGTLRTVTLTDLNPCASYCFRVRSQCTGAPLPQYSSTSGSFTTTSGASCVAVSNVSIANSSGCNYTVSWSNCVTADSFRVRYKLSSASVWSFSPWSTSYNATVTMGPGSWMVRVQSKCGTTIYTTGTTNYSIGSCRMAGVSDELVSNLVLFPNPTTERSVLNFTSMDEGNYVVNISDISGRVLRTMNGNAVAGENTAILSVADLSKGIYFVSLELAGETKQIKLIVQ